MLIRIENDQEATYNKLHQHQWKISQTREGRTMATSSLRIEEEEKNEMAVSVNR